MPKLTKRVIDATKPGERDLLLWDSELRGFGLRIKPAGAKSYCLQYRNAEGRSRRYTIGKHGPLTPDKAREKAIKLLAQIADGADPAAGRTEERQALTIQELANLYLIEGVRDRPNKKLSSWKQDQSNIRRHILPLLGNRKARALTRLDVVRFQADVADGRTAADEKLGPHARSIVRGGQGTANRARAVLSALLSWAREQGYIQTNPAIGITPFKRPPKERFMTDAEVTLLADTLAEMEADTSLPFVAGTAVRLLLLTGCRKGEILSLRWENVDLERRCLRLGDSKTGAKVVPLAASALELLSELPRKSKWVLPSEKAAGHFVGLQKIWERVRKRAKIVAVRQAEERGDAVVEMRGLDGLRIHDARHSFASFAVSDGAALYLVGKVLGHRQSRTTEIYSHVPDSPFHATAELAAQRIARAMKLGTPLKDPSDAAPLKGR